MRGERKPENIIYWRWRYRDGREPPLVVRDRVPSSRPTDQPRSVSVLVSTPPGRERQLRTRTRWSLEPPPLGRSPVGGGARPPGKHKSSATGRAAKTFSSPVFGSAARDEIVFEVLITAIPRAHTHTHASSAEREVPHEVCVINTMIMIPPTALPVSLRAWSKTPVAPDEYVRMSR